MTDEAVEMSSITQAMGDCHNEGSKYANIGGKRCEPYSSSEEYKQDVRSGYLSAMMTMRVYKRHSDRHDSNVTHNSSS